MKRRKLGLKLTTKPLILVAAGAVIVASLLIVLIGDSDKQANNRETIAINNPNLPKKNLIRVCPEHWYYDKMPGPIERSEESRQYFIINGERVEFKDVDVQWVKKNCGISEPEIIQ